MGRLRAEDRRDLRLGFATLFVMMASHALAETARDALFLTRLDAAELPWAYLAIAALVGVVLRVLARLRRSVPDKRRLLAGTMLIAGVVDITLGVAVPGAPGAAVYGLYAWTGLVATLLILQVWLLLEEVVTVAQAKRIFGPVAAGGVLGALAGSAAADRLLAMAQVDAAGLLVAAGLVLAAGAGLPLMWREGEHTPAAESPPANAGLLEICHHVYLRRLLLVVLFSTVVFTLGDYVFKSVVARSMPAEELPAFFARYQILLNGAALLVQLLLSGWILRAFGVSRALFVLPLAMLVGALGFLAAPVLLPVLLLKGADGALRHSLHRTATEVLYLPLSAAVRDRAKGIIDGVGQRGGQALASLGLLGALTLGAEPQHFVIALVVGALAWCAVLVGLRRPYLQLFRAGLRGGEVRGRLAELDLHALESLLAALNSEVPEEVVAALDLFERYDRVALVPRVLLHHPDRVVKIRALAVFAAQGDTAFGPLARRLVDDDDRGVRVAALRALVAIEDPATLYPPFLKTAAEGELPPCPALHATALVGLATGSGAQGWTSEEPLRAEHARELDRLLVEGDAVVREQLALAMRAHPDLRFATPLLRLVLAPERPVRHAAALAIEALARTSAFRARARGARARERREEVVRSFLSGMLPLLADGLVRPAVRRAFVAIGREALDALDEALALPVTDDRTRRGDRWDAGLDRTSLHGEGLPRRVRRHLPRTISRFPARWAAPVLLRHLQREEDGAVRYKLLRGLGRLRAAHPEVGIDEPWVVQRVRATLDRVVTLLELRVAVRDHHRPAPGVEPDWQLGDESDAAGGHLGAELLDACLEEKERNALERVFRLLGLLHPEEELEVLWRGVRSANPRSHAAALEVLGSLPVLQRLGANARGALLALLDDTRTRTRLQNAAAALGRPLLELRYPDRLAAALHDPSETIRSFVAHHVAELDLRDLAPELETARPEREGFVSEVIDRALRRFRGPEDDDAPAVGELQWEGQGA